MTTPTTPDQRPEHDWAAIAQWLGDLFRQIADALTRIVREVLVFLDVVRRVLGPYTEGVGRCHGPVPLAVDGHAYRRRTRRR